MSYQVIARKYRPQRFADVVGQEHVTQTLANAIASGRIAHAYIFCGPRGTGKTTLARIFAKCLNCTDGPKADFPDDDPRAQEISEGRCLDVLEIDGASNNGIEQIRELRETVKFAPASSRFKVYIIDEVHMLSTSAFNALLKTLEEPPAHVKFLFATTDPEKVLPTILSRCQRFDLRRIPAALIAQHLGEICQKEGVTIDEPALFAVARGAEGGMRDAQSALDQLISFCGTHVTEAEVLAMFGLTGRGQLLDLTLAIIQGETERVLRILDELARGGRDLTRLLGDLVGHFRNLMLYLVSRGDRILIEVSDVEYAALGDQSNQVDAEAATRILEVLTLAEGRFREAASKRIYLEVLLVKAIQARSAVSLDVALRQLNALRDPNFQYEAKPISQSVATKRSAPSSVPPSESRPKSPPDYDPSKPSAVSADVRTTDAPTLKPEQLRNDDNNTPISIREAGASQAPHSSSLTTHESATNPPNLLQLPAEVRKEQTSPIDRSAPPLDPVPVLSDTPTPNQSRSNELLADPDSLFSAVLDELALDNLFLKSALEDARSLRIESGIWTLACPQEFFDVQSPDKVKVTIQKILVEMVGEGLTVDFIREKQDETSPDQPASRSESKKKAAGPKKSVNKKDSFSDPDQKVESSKPSKTANREGKTSQSPEPSTLTKEEFLQDPLIQQAMDIFKGQIVEVQGSDSKESN
jgi:DNA polymerase-3 subunit gamma/tau